MKFDLEKTQVMVYFSLFGNEFPLDYVTEILEITPSESYKKGDLIERPHNSNLISSSMKHYRKSTVWEISTDYQESFDVKEQLNQIIGLLKNKVAELNRLKADFDLKCTFTIVIVMENGITPGLQLNNEQIEFANSIKAEFDIDLYANSYKENFDD